MTTQSTQRTVDLARRLRAAGARFYGAFWCSHCFEQKVAFGAAAAKELPYVECYPDGFHKVLALCSCAPVEAFLPVCGSTGLLLWCSTPTLRAYIC